MRYAFPALLALCGACAPPGPTPGSAAPASTPEVMIDQRGKVYRTVDVANTTTMDAKPADVVRALAASYDAIGIPADVVDPARQLVSRSSITMARAFKGQRLSALFDCGQGQILAHADDGRVTFSLTSQVSGTAAPVSVTTRIDASVVPNDGTSSNRMRCASTGVLEERIRKQTLLQLGIAEVTR